MSREAGAEGANELWTFLEAVAVATAGRTEPITAERDKPKANAP
jgi:hypothetical protein